MVDYRRSPIHRFALLAINFFAAFSTSTELSKNIIDQFIRRVSEEKERLIETLVSSVDALEKWLKYIAISNLFFQ